MHVGSIGSGVMIATIARGGVAAGMNALDFLSTDAHGVHVPALAAELGVGVASPNGSLVHQVDTLALGVKPHMQNVAIKMVTHIVRERPEMCVVSLAVGRTVEPIAKDFGAAVPTIRVMPNANAQIGRSMSVICSLGTSKGQVATVKAPMNKMGRSIHIGRKDSPAFQAFVGCSPAWVFQIIEALARAGVKHGLTKEVSVAIAARALMDLADLVLETFEQDTVPSELIDRACSPGDTTIAGLLAVEAQGTSMYLVSAVEAVIARGAEVSTHIK